MISLRPYKIILWDWNGTLLDDAWLCVDVMNGMLRERHMRERTLEQYRDIFDFPVKDYYVTLGFDFDREPFEEVGMEFMVKYNQRQQETSLHPGVFQVLQTMEQKGYRQFILSAREQNELTLELINLGVFRYFEGVYGLDDHYAHGKTDVGRRLLSETGANPAEIVFIGDTRHDAEVADEIGVECILVPNGHHSRDRLVKLGRPLVGSVTDLITMV